MINRKVRFNLPRNDEGGQPPPPSYPAGGQPQFDFSRLVGVLNTEPIVWDNNQTHSTKQYVNGMLVNRSQVAPPPQQLQPQPPSKPAETPKQKIDINLQFPATKTVHPTNVPSPKETPPPLHRLSTCKSLPAIRNKTASQTAQKGEKVNRSRSGLFSSGKKSENVTVLKPNEIKLLPPPPSPNVPIKPQRTRVKTAAATVHPDVRPTVPLKKSSSFLSFNFKSRSTKSSKTTPPPPTIQAEGAGIKRSTSDCVDSKFKNYYINSFKSSGQYLTVPDLDDDDIFESFATPFLSTSASTMTSSSSARYLKIISVLSIFNNGNQTRIFSLRLL